MKKTKRFVLADWQRNPQNVKTDHVQLWSWEGGMLTALLTKTKAQELVSCGACFVMTGQAVSYLPKS